MEILCGDVGIPWGLCAHGPALEITQQRSVKVSWRLKHPGPASDRDTGTRHTRQARVHHLLRNYIRRQVND